MLNRYIDEHTGICISMQNYSMCTGTHIFANLSLSIMLISKMKNAIQMKNVLSLDSIH